MISDEIHCDIVEPGCEYVPALSISKDIITCLAPSKVFNLAGLHSAITVVNNPDIKEKVQSAFYHDDIGEPNYFCIPATIAAYTKGAQYVDELNQYLYNNKQYIKDYLNKYIPNLKVVSGQATYLLWLDISYYHIPSDVFVKELRAQTGLYINDGLHYGTNGGNFVRINIATSLENVKDGMNRLYKYLKGKNMRKDFGPQTWLFPLPVLILGTYDENGNPDAMNAAWGGMYDNQQIIISLSSHQTTDNIRKKKALTVSFATVETVTASDYVGIVSQKMVKDKIANSGLHYEKAPHIDAPLFTDYPLTLECEVLDIINEGEGGGNVIAKIVNASADESVLTDGKVDPSKINFISFDPIRLAYVKLGEPVAKAFVEGMKLKK